MQPGRAKIVHHLRGFAGRDDGERLDFDEHGLETDEFGAKVQRSQEAVVADWESHFAVKGNAVPMKLYGQTFGIDRFEKAAPHPLVHIDRGPDDGLRLWIAEWGTLFGLHSGDGARAMPRGRRP